MKKVALFMLVVSSLLFGCSKDKDTKVSNNATISMSGQTYTITDMEWSLDTKYEITNWGENYKNELFIYLETKKTGEITMNSVNFVSYYIGLDEYEMKSGKITISKFDDNVIQGTFTGRFIKNAGSAEVDATGTFYSIKFTNSK